MEGPMQDKKRKLESSGMPQNGKKNKSNVGNEPQKKKRKYKNKHDKGGTNWTYIRMGVNDNEGQDQEKKEVLSHAPREIKVVEFAHSRAAEIEALSKLMTKAQGTRQLSQLLPKHMRRRACSHNIKRLPRRVQMVAQKEYENQEGKAKAKRPSRKHRRRPKNLLQEYNRRQRKHVWLETHIWHAKRFKMADKWGYRVPVQPTDKSSRAAYRATQHHCQIRDISFMCCIDIQGPEENIINGLQHLCSPLTGRTFAAKSFLGGVCEGQTMLYAFDKYPYGAISCVSFLWKPLLGDRNVPISRQLWLWCHPACYEEVWTELEKCFRISEHVSDEKSLKCTKICSDEGENISDHNKDKKERNSEMQNEGRKLENRLISLGSVKLESLKDNLVRFRFTGPLSHTVLSDLLKLADILPSVKNSDLWWQKYYENEDASLGYTQQREFWEYVTKCQSVAELPPHCILGLTVRDPRLMNPLKRMKIVPDDEDIDTDISVIKEKLTPDISDSPLWHSDIRENVKNTKMSEAQLNYLKSEQLIPGTDLILGQKESRIPVLLLQNPGIQKSRSKTSALTVNTNYGAGFDLILPASWSMAFWVGSIYRGARPGGIRESKSLAKEQGLLHFPEDFPDTNSGKLEELEIYEQLSTKYEKRPPAKRANYSKLGIVSPFICAWSQLVNEWNKEMKLSQKINVQTTLSGENDTFYVLRNQQELRQLEGLCCNDISSRNVNKFNCQINESGQFIAKFKENELDISFVTGKEYVLIPVKVTMVTRGAPEEFATICLPTTSDINTLLGDKTYSGPIENVHPDLNKCKKKDKRRVKGHDKPVTAENSDQTVNQQTVTDSEKSDEKMKLRCLPVIKNVVDSCDRRVMGCLKHGGYNLGQGYGSGVGFCSVLALAKLLTVTPKGLPCIALLRNPMSRQYRFTFITVLNES